jgi:bifunctional non-homologous end joining protein LigD
VISVIYGGRKATCWLGGWPCRDPLNGHVRGLQILVGMKLEALQLAQLVDAAPEGDEWLHEQKFDGYRILAELRGKEVLLQSRRFNDWTTQFPTVVDAVQRLRATSAVIDGEVCVVMPDGRTSFQALQSSFGRRDANIVYFVFDLLELDGEDLTGLPLEQRKARLKKLVGTKNPHTVRYSDHVIGNGGTFFELACKQGLEGIVSKRRDKPYAPGRGRTWVKTKCLLRQELVIGGFTDPGGSRSGIGALLVGYHEKGKLVYAGKVGTGFSMKVLGELRRALEPYELSKCPFTPEPARAWTGPNRHWVAPVLVAEVTFSEWTNDGRLRHPVFQGLRSDKPATEIVRERAAHLNR